MLSLLKRYLSRHVFFSSSTCDMMQQQCHTPLFTGLHLFVYTLHMPTWSMLIPTVFPFLLHKAFKLYIHHTSQSGFWVIFNLNLISILPMKVKEIPLSDVMWGHSRGFCSFVRCMVDCWLLECRLKSKHLNTACGISNDRRSHRKHQIFLFWRRSPLINSNIKIKLWCFHVSA